MPAPWTVRTVVVTAALAAAGTACAGHGGVTVSRAGPRVANAQAVASTQTSPARNRSVTTVATTVTPTTTIPPRPTAPTTTTTSQGGPVLEAAPRAAPVNEAGNGTQGPGVTALQHRLAQLGYWTNTDGKFGWDTQQAVMAFQKYNGLEPTGRADAQTAAVLNLARYRVLAQGWEKDMIEVDKGRQLLFVVRGGRTVWAFNTSTGSGHLYEELDRKTPGKTVAGRADTPVGTFHVYMQQSEGWWKGSLGELYRPKFFAGGSAIHGAPKVPNYPASHGCVRVTPDAMDFIWSAKLLPIGMTVWVHP
jgi:lipoprotein-anchoring transpeptidase ErfK/SrfK